MKPRPTVIIIHGTGGHPDRNWFPWLKQQVLVLGYDASIPAFPTPEGQSLPTWKTAFREQIGSLASNMILVGHSIGAGFALNLLEDASQPVIATYLVAGFLGRLGIPEFDVLNESFVCRDFDWQKILTNIGHSHIFHSDNDPYVPLSKGEDLAKKLKIKATLVPGAQHINEEAGYLTFPLILAELKSDLSKTISARQ
jgi:hypothetical protein